MTTEEVRDLLHDLLLWRQAQDPGTPGGGIRAAERGSGSLAVTFGDGTRHLIAVLTEGGQP